MEDKVLPCDIWPERSVKTEEDCLRDLEPCLADCHPSSHIRRSDTSRECTDRAICACMAICSNDHITSCDKSLLRKKRMLNARLPYFEVILYRLALCESTHTCTLLCGLYILIRREMIRHKGNPVLVKDILLAEFRKFLYSHRACYIIAKDHIEIGHDKLPWMDFFLPGCCSEDLLCHCHRHFRPPYPYALQACHYRRTC